MPPPYVCNVALSAGRHGRVTVTFGDIVDCFEKRDRKGGEIDGGIGLKFVQSGEILD